MQMFSFFMNLFFCGFYIFFIIIGIAALALFIFMLVDVLQRKDNEFGDSFGKDAKLIWILLLVFTNWIGCIIYYILVYRKIPRKK